MITREEALKKWRLMTLEAQKKLHEQSDHSSWAFGLFKASTQAIQQAMNKGK